MEDIENNNGKDHHGTVQSDKVTFRGDQISGPALGQLDGSVDTSNVDADDGEHHSAEQGVDVAGRIAEQLIFDAAADEVGSADDEDGDGEHLEDNPCNHDVRAVCSVTVDLVGFGGGHTATDSLNDEGDDIAGAENPEVKARAENRGFAT